MQSPNKEYEIRKGTLNWGREYEINMLVLLSLRCVRQSTEDFWFAWNVDGVGAFDDVVLRLGDHTFMLQMKHKESPDAVTTQEYLKWRKQQKEFYLKKYIDDMCDIRNKMHSCKVNNTSKDIITQLGSFDNIYFLLYTNRPTNLYDFLEHNNSSGYFSYLNSKNGLIYRINVTHASTNFNLNNVSGIDNFYLFCNQINAKDLSNEIKKEIKEITRSKYSKTICKDYMEFITEWSRGSLGGHYCLTRHHVVSKLTELVVNDYEVELLGEPYRYYEDGQKLVWNRIIEDKSITVINTNQDDTLILHFLFEYIGSEVKKYCNVTAKQSWSDSLSQVERGLLYKQDVSFESLMLKLSGSRQEAVLFNVYKCLWNLQKLPLLLEINKREQYDQILNILQLSNYSYKLIILNHSGRSLTLNKKVNNFANSQDLNCEHKEEILEQQIRFQGRNGARLRVLVDKTMLTEITTTDIINILLNRYNIGKELNYVPKYYIPRSLYKRHGRYTHLFNEKSSLLTDLVTVISAGPGMGKSMLMDSIAREIPTHKWVIKIDLRKHNSYYQTLPNKRLKSSEYLDYFVSFLNNELEKRIFKRLFENKDIVIFMDGFDEISISYKKEVTDIAKSFYQDKLSLCLTTRPIEKTYLEKEFKVIAKQLFSFDLTQQHRFLKEYLNEDETFFSNINEAPDKFVQNLLTTFNENVSSKTNFEDENNDFTATPLHIKLLSEVFRDDIKLNNGKINQQFDLVDLYTMFIQKKNKILCDKFGSTDSFDLYKDYQALLALRLLFPRWEKDINEYIKEEHGKIENKQIRLLEKGGILTVDQEFNLDFVHQRFAEYLAAEWLSVNIDSENETIKTIAEHVYKTCISLNYSFSILRYPFLLNVFDSLLMKTDLHGDDFYKNIYSCIINGQTEVIKEKINLIPTRLDATDRASRSILHLIIIYSLQYPSLQGISSAIIEKTSDMQADLFGYNPIDYALKYDFYESANLMFAKWPGSTIRIYKSETKEFLRQVESYPYLWKSLLAYFTYRDTMLNKVKKDETVGSFLENYSPFEDTNLKLCELSDLKLYTRSNLCYEVVFEKKNTVQELLQTCDKVNAKDANGFTPLHYAAFYGKKNMINLLLSNNANPNIMNVNCNTPLHYTIINGKFEAFRKLLDKSNINAKCKYYNTSLHYAVMFKRLKMIKLLLLKGADAESENYIEDTPLHLLAQGSDMEIPQFLFGFFPSNVLEVKVIEEECCEMIDLFIANGTDIKMQNSSDETPLHYSAKTGNSKIVSKLISHVSDVNIILNRKGNTPLHCALHNYNYRNEGYFETINLLLLKGANVNIKNVKGKTPLYYGVRYGDCKVIEKLILCDADVNAQDGRGNTPLHSAISKRKNLDITTLLLSKCANVNIKNIEGETPFHHGVRHGDYKVIEGLTLFGADATVKDNKGNTPLQEAVYKRGDINITRLLISKDTKFDARNVEGEIPLDCDDCEISQNLIPCEADINAQNEAGNTPLHLAISKGQNLDITRLLLSKGANVNIKNLEGKTPFHYSIIVGDFKVIQELMLYKVDINVQDNAGNAPLHEAVFKRKDLDIIRLLLSSDAQVNIKNINGVTPFHYAVIFCNYQIVRELILSNADINMQDNSGNTPLHYAISKRCSVPVAELILSRGANANIRNSEGKTPFYSRVRYDGFRVIDGMVILETAARWDGAAEDGLSHQALSHEDHITSSVENTSKSTSIDLTASEQKEPGIISFLLSNGADPNTANFNKETPLHISVVYQNYTAAEMLILQEVDMNARDIAGSTPLDRLPVFRSHECIRVRDLLLSHGACRTI